MYLATYKACYVVKLKLLLFLTTAVSCVLRVECKISFFAFTQLSPSPAVSSSDEGHELALELRATSIIFWMSV